MHARASGDYTAQAGRLLWGARPRISRNRSACVVRSCADGMQFARSQPQLARGGACARVHGCRPGSARPYAYSDKCTHAARRDHPTQRSVWRPPQDAPTIDGCVRLCSGLRRGAGASLLDTSNCDCEATRFGRRHQERGRHPFHSHVRHADGGEGALPLALPNQIYCWILPTANRWSTLHGVGPNHPLRAATARPIPPILTARCWCPPR
eukprot:76731-Prymnesium_polylepis.2